MNELILILTVLFSGIAAYTDIRTNKISNTLILFTLISISIFLIAGNISISQHILSFILTFSLLLIPYALGWLAGGDIKLMAALSMGIPFPNTFLWLGSIFFLGGIVALGAYFKKRQTIAYGIAIFGGTCSYGMFILFAG